MLSLFPELLFLAPFSALLLRAVLVYFLLKAAYKHVSRTPEIMPRMVAAIEVGASLLLLLGAYAQLGALLSLFLAGFWLVHPRIRPVPHSTAALLFFISLSILITGPGAFAFDIPL